MGTTILLVVSLLVSAGLLLWALRLRAWGRYVESTHAADLRDYGEREEQWLADRERLEQTTGELREQYSLLEQEVLETRRELISLACTVSGCESYAYCEGCKTDAYAIRKKYYGDSDRGGPFMAGLGDECEEHRQLFEFQHDAHVREWVRGGHHDRYHLGCS